MQKFSEVNVDMSDTSSIFQSFKQIAQYFREVRSSPTASVLSVPDEAWAKAVAILHPVAFYLQMKAPDSVKEKLGEMLGADQEVIEQICEAILFPFIEGQW